MELKTILITQARVGSTRLPGKILKEVNGKSLLEIHLERLKKCIKISEIIVATTINNPDKVIYDKALEWGYSAFRGSESNVLDRFYHAVKNSNADWIVRVTSDCPLLDPVLVDDIISFAHHKNYDYVSNSVLERFPDGQDVEVFKFSALKTAFQNATLKSDLEHVTPYIRNNANGKGANFFSSKNFDCEKDFSAIRMTVDEQRDFELIEYLIQKLGTDKTWLEYTNYIIENDLIKMNNQIVRNEGFLKSLKNNKNG
ncbi:cytidylyltransferase domain-containing protein [Polaribacter sp. BAL334]|uniref:cytidylyltransferase domain-containing protein n=1 Tax=Polaribacter sp. BAL334 TaxID=1708178 RepID=UPI0018D22BE0|nr:glycosyltransferase family protein [Polaribacter sp. BAL334]